MYFHIFKDWKDIVDPCVAMASVSDFYAKHDSNLKVASSSLARGCYSFSFAVYWVWNSMFIATVLFVATGMPGCH